MKGKTNFKQIVSYLLMFMLSFSIFQAVNFKPVKAVNQVLPEVTIKKGSSELEVNKLGNGEYVAEYIDPSQDSGFYVTANDGWTITNIEPSENDGMSGSEKTLDNGKKQYIFTGGKQQGYFYFNITVAPENGDQNQTKTYAVKMVYSDNEALQFSKIVVTDTSNIYNKVSVTYGEKDSEGNYKVKLNKSVTNAKIDVYDSDNNIIGQDITYNGSSNNVVELNGGDNPVEIVVTNGLSSVTYNLIISKEGEALLQELQPSQGTLSPAFNSNIFDYEITVPTETETIAFTPVSVDNSSTITVDGVTVKSGRKSADIDLDEGSNKIPIVVTTKEGGIATYNVKVIRTEKDRSSYLSGLTLSSGTLDPGFNKELTEYNVSVENDVSSIYVTPTAEDPNATIKVNGTKVKSGVPSKYINLDEGPNTINIKVLDEKENSTVYVLKVSRKYSEDNVNLSALSLSSGKLSPSFDPDTYLYSAKVNRNIDNVRVKFTCQNDAATITINDKEYQSGQQSDKIPLTLGANLITLKVVAEDGDTTTTYKISVIRGEIEGRNDWVLVSGNWTFYDGYGKQIKNDWVKYDNKYYRLDVNGHLITGWFKEDNDWYFLRNDGQMVTGWMYEKGYWYYFHENGKMAANKWYTLDTHTYYFNERGEMQTGWMLYNGKWYYLGKSGVMQKGWITYDKNKYYLNSDGTMKTGWIFTGTTWYYLDTTGKLVSGWQTINGHRYYFDDKGAMQTGIKFIDGQWINLGNL